MRRKYEVYIDGRRSTIVGEADARAGFERSTMERAGSSKAIAATVAAWQNRSDGSSLVLVGEDADEVWENFCANYRFVQAAGGCVTDEHMRLLAIHRLGLWDLPKGKVDPGEAVDHAAVREVREECGLVNVELLQRLCETWHTYERKGIQHLKRTDWYLMRASSSEQLVAQHEEDISEVRWMDAAGIAELERGTYPSLLPVIAAWASAVQRRA